MMQHVDTALIVGCYICLISMYVWVFKQVEEVKEMVHAHNESKLHVSSDDLVFRDVCQIQVKRFEERITEVKEDVSKVQTGMDKGFEDIKNLLKDKS